MDLFIMIRKGAQYLRMMIFLLPLCRLLPACAQSVPAHGELSRFSTSRPSADTTEINQLLTVGADIQETLPDSAWVLFHQALRSSRQAGFTYGIVRSLNYLGMLASLRGAEREAVFFYYKAIEAGSVLPGTDNHGDLGVVYNNVARSLSQTSQTYNVLPYLDKAEEIAQREKDYPLLAGVLQNKGIVFAHQDKLDTAISYLLRAAEVAGEHGLVNKQYPALLNLASFSILENNPEQSLIYLAQARQLKGRIDKSYQDFAVFYTGRAYLYLKDYHRAEQYLSEALQRTEAPGSDYIIPMEIHLMLADLYGATGQYRQAFRHQRKYQQLKDSLHGRNVTQDISRFEAKYKTEKKDREIAEQQLQLAQKEIRIREKNRWITVITISTVFFAVLSVLLYSGYRRRQHLQKKQIQVLQQEQKIEQLHAIMEGEERERNRIGRDLHDGIGGMLAAINMQLKTLQKRHRDLAAIDELNEVTGMVQVTAAEVRKTAHNLIPDVLQQYDLPEAVRLYCSQVTSNELQIVFQSHGSLEYLPDPLALFIYRMIQELIQNIIKHAGATLAIVQIRELEGIVSISVEDNGIGFETQEIHAGLGLKNLRSRINALGGYISIESTRDTGTTIYIEFDPGKLQIENAV